MPTTNSTPHSAPPISHAPQAFGDTDALPFVAVDAPMTPLAMNCHAQPNGLADHLLVNLEEKRRGVEDLLEQTLKMQSIVASTLGSCYPRPMLDLHPEWFQSKPYRARAVKEPGGFLREFGTRVSDDVTIRAQDSNSNKSSIVVPMRHWGTESPPEAKLAFLVTREPMIDVSTVKTPEPVAAGRP